MPQALEIQRTHLQPRHGPRASGLEHHLDHADQPRGHRPINAPMRLPQMFCIASKMRPSAKGAVPTWTASTSMAGKTTFILAGWLGMNVVV